MPPFATMCSTVAPAGEPPTTHDRRLTMTWTTPQACDLRFGFEITMYIAAK